MLKKSLLFTFLLLIILGSAYTAGWHYFASIIDREVAKFVELQKLNNVIFTGDFTPAHGFPGKYKVIYTGDIMTPAGKIDIPKLELSGIPLEGQNINVNAPLGLRLQTRILPQHLKKIESASLVFTIPTGFPPEFNAPYVKLWHAKGNANIQIPSLRLQWPDASIYAEAELRLNDDLQPEGEAKLGVTNHTFFFELIADQMRLPKTQRLMALTFLNALKQENGAVIIPVKLKENALYLGIARVATLPFIFWPEQGRARPDSPLAPPQ